LRAIQLFNTQASQECSESRSNGFGANFTVAPRIESETTESRQNRSDRQPPTVRIG